MIKVSIIIVDFKKADRVIRNMESLANQDVNFDIEVIIVDNSCNAENAEKLKSLKAYHGVRLFISEKNMGYIRANNFAAKLAQGRYLLICNPDIAWTKPDALQKMAEFMDKYERVGICGPKQVNESDGSIAMTVRAWPSLPLQIARRTWIRQLPVIKSLVEYDEMQHLNYEETQTVDWMQSSCWLVRKTMWEKLEGLNKDYFLFMSDPDLCYRAWESGFEVVYLPEAEVVADGQRLSSGGVKDFFTKWTLRQHCKEAVKYSLSHLFRGNPHERYLTALSAEKIAEERS